MNMDDKKSHEESVPLRIRIFDGRVFEGDCPFIDPLGTCYLNNATEFNPECPEGEYIGKAYIRREAILSVERLS